MQAPYGTWKSPITAEAVASGATALDEVLVDPVTSAIYHIEKRPSEGGRNVLVNTKTGLDVVGREWNVRSRVHEYGGAAATVYNGQVYFSHYADGRVYQMTEGQGNPQPITPANPNHRYAHFEVHPCHNHLLAVVLEDHTMPHPSTVVNSLCVINTLEGTTKALAIGASFYTNPIFSPNGDYLAWRQWCLPQMPWEGAEIRVAKVFVIQTLSDNKVNSIECKMPSIVAGNETTSVFCPSWANDDTLVFLNDQSGYQNPWKYALSSGVASPIFTTPIPYDFCGNASAMGNSFYAYLDPSGSTAVFAAYKDGRSVLFYADLRNGDAPDEVECPFVDIQYLRTLPTRAMDAIFLGMKTHETPGIIRCTFDSPKHHFKPTYQTLRSTPPSKLSTVDLKFSLATPLSLTLHNPATNLPLPIIIRIPTNAKYSGSSVPYEQPPCIVNVHGGPTKMTSPALDFTKIYFTSRGWAWLDVNFRGSACFGRAFRKELEGKWGVADVEDCVFAAQALSRSPYSMIDPDRIVIRGASAGGYTALRALCDSRFSTFFAAGASLYGISDLRKLLEHTHKYESGYGEGLIGGRADVIPEVYLERSPIFQATNIVQPLLILQGSVDKVVPKEQSELIVDSLQSRNGDVKYHLFEGEGHGWRQAANITAALEIELSFYEKVLSLKRDNMEL